jgi:pimeloyl-ACP methyl ester carboxylesterase
MVTDSRIGRIIARIGVALACSALLALHQPAALAQAVPAAKSSPEAPTKAPDCTHCKDRLKTVDALKAQLPQDWHFQFEREPVFGSEMLIVQAGRTKAQTLLLVHGLGQNGFTDWLPVMSHLARRYHIIAVDLPGFGYSDIPTGRYSPTNYARVLQSVLARRAKGQAIVIGHSMGAAVALRLASQQPALVSKLILADAAGILHRTTFVKHRANIPVSNTPEALRGPLASVTEFGNRMVERVFNLPDFTRILKESDLAWDLLLRNRSNVNAALALMDEDFSAAVHTLQQPTQILWGEADNVAPLRTGQLLARRLPRAELKTMPRVGHTPMEDAPDLFLSLLSSALASDPAPRSQPPVAGSLEPVNLRCDDRVDQEFSGTYREVVITRCRAARLINLNAERIVIRDSIVQMHNVHVRATDVALDVTSSEVIATASDFSGEVAIRADASRIDLAGVHLLSIGNAVEVNRFSRFIASISRIQSPDYSGYWHDQVDLKEGRLVPARRRD